MGCWSWIRSVLPSGVVRRVRNRLFIARLERELAAKRAAHAKAQEQRAHERARLDDAAHDADEPE